MHCGGEPQGQAGNRRDMHCNDRKAVISVELPMIFDRLGSTSDSWWSRLEKLSQARLPGRYFTAKRQRLREVTRDFGVHHHADLGGSPAR